MNAEADERGGSNRWINPQGGQAEEAGSWSAMRLSYTGLWRILVSSVVKL